MESGSRNEPTPASRAAGSKVQAKGKDGLLPRERSSRPKGGGQWADVIRIIGSIFLCSHLAPYLVTSDDLRRLVHMRLSARKPLLILFEYGLLVYGLTGDAQAQTYDTYRADLGRTAFCSAKGGACASADDPENGFFRNPAALLADKPGTNFDADYIGSNNLEPGMKKENAVSETVYLAGFGYSWERFAIGVGLNGRQTTVESTAHIYDDLENLHTLDVTTTSTFIRLNVPVAFRLSPEWILGASLMGRVTHDSVVVPDGSSAKITNTDSFPALSFAVGAHWIYSENFRFGSWIRTPLTSHQRIEIESPGFGSPINYREDVTLHFPWYWAGGVSWKPWTDLRTLSFDINVVGTTDDGYLLSHDTFTSSVNAQKLRRKGSALVIEPHIGWQSPWTEGSPGSYLLGTYFEKGRSDGLSGRLHASAGVAYKFRYFEALLGIEVSRNYSTLLINIR